jgi:hypothetical protein
MFLLVILLLITAIPFFGMGCLVRWAIEDDRRIARRMKAIAEGRNPDEAVG